MAAVMKEDKYSFGRCERCGQVKALKNGVCKECEISLPEFLSGLFGGE